MTDLLPMTILTQQLMQRTLQKTAIALPFAQDIFLLETHVAGLHYYDIKNLHEPLKITDTLQLCREPTNSHDELAIEIFTLSRQKLGYVPRFRNPILARLMDAGKLLVAEVASLQFGHGAVSGFQQVDDSGSGIVDVRFKIALRE